ERNVNSPRSPSNRTGAGMTACLIASMACPLSWTGCAAPRVVQEAARGAAAASLVTSRPVKCVLMKAFPGARCFQREQQLQSLPMSALPLKADLAERIGRPVIFATAPRSALDDGSDSTLRSQMKHADALTLQARHCLPFVVIAVQRLYDRYVVDSRV